MKRLRLTEDDLRTIRMAINDAMRDRDSYADAYSYAGKEASEALLQMRSYEALHVKLFGCPSARTQDAEEMAKWPTVSIFKL